MDSSIFAFLKRKALTDINTVNRLFVSAFVKSADIEVKKNLLIKNLLICKDDNDSSLFEEFYSKIVNTDNPILSIEDMIQLFEFVISPADRIVTGAVYTPTNIRTAIIDSCLQNKPKDKLQSLRIADISCGCGGFLMDAAYYLHKHSCLSFRDIYRNNIFGIDIMAYSVDRTKILLSLLALFHHEDENFDFNVLEADTLEFCSDNWNQSFSGFDIIVGNPPYVCSRRVTEETKAKMLRYKVSLSGHPDLYIPFFQIATEMANENGIVGFITMNSFIHSINGRAVREYFSRNSYDISIVDFRGYQVFNRKSTYTCLFFLYKSLKNGKVHYSVNENGHFPISAKYLDIAYNALNNKSGWALNKHHEVQILETHGTPILKYCSSRHGIATLSNKVYIFSPINEDNYYYSHSHQGHYFQIEKDICRDIANPNKLNSKNSVSDIIEKVIFPYTINNNRIAIIDEATMKSKYPKAYEYLLFNYEDLHKRDKGKTDNYPEWYAYGRTQSLIMPTYKLFYPKIANKPLFCELVNNERLLSYNGLTFISDTPKKLLVLKCILESSVFWWYVTANSKPYSSGYYSLSGVDINSFKIPDLSEAEVQDLLSIQDKKRIDEWIERKYSIPKRSSYWACKALYQTQ